MLTDKIPNWLRAFIQNNGSTITLKKIKEILNSAQSTLPSNPSIGDLYLDDGTNTSSGNIGWRAYDGTSWIDIGGGGIANIVEDTTPQLGGNLDAQGNSINNVSLPSTQVIESGVGANAWYGTQEPNAMYIASANKTFIAVRGNSADPYALAYDHDTQEWTEKTKIGTNPNPDSDGHGPPTMAINSSGTIFIVYGAHNASFQIAKSTNTYDITAWTDLGAITTPPDGTYPSIACDDSDNLWIAYRTGACAGTTYPTHDFGTLIKSTDDGSSWTDEGPIINLTGHPDSVTDAYMNGLYHKNGNLHVTWIVAHGSSHDDLRSNIYHAYYDISDGNMYDLAGNSYGSTITWSEHSNGVLQAVTYDDIPTAHAVPYNGGWVIGFQEDTGNTGTYTKRLATYSGGSWSDEQIGSATSEVFGHYTPVRINKDGNIEVHAMVNSSEHYTVGGDWVKFTKAGGQWETEYLISASNQFTPVKTAIIRNGKEELTGLCTEVTHTNVEKDFHSSLVGYGSFQSPIKNFLNGLPGLSAPITQTEMEDITNSAMLLTFLINNDNMGIQLTSTDYLLLKNAVGGTGLINTGSGDDGKLLVNTDGSVESSEGGFVPAPYDLTGINGNRDGEIRIHDGTAPLAEGLYRWNGSDSSWKPIGNNLETSAVKAYAGSDWNLADSSFEAIPADTEVYDRLGEWDTTNYEFTPQKDGIYLVGGAFLIASPGDGTRMIIQFLVNGSQKAKSYQHAGVDSYLEPLVSTQLKLAANDVLTIKVFQDSGVQKTVTGGEVASFVTVKKIG